MIHKLCTFMLKREKEMEEIYYYISSPFSFVKMACQVSKLNYATTGEVEEEEEAMGPRR